MLITPERAELVVLSGCVLHNFLRIRFPAYTNHLLDREDAETHEIIPGAWRDDEAMQSIEAMHGNNNLRAAKAQREYLSSYVNSIGAVSWQDRMI
jgi:hypothetical protein